MHRKTIRGELWEKQANTLPACVDCHQPHKVRNVFYSQGMADADCMRCHANASLKSADGRSMLVRVAEVAGSRHVKVACSQCHSEVNASRVRPCETITHAVDCTACHAEVGQQYQRSTHGQMHAKGDATLRSARTATARTTFWASIIRNRSPSRPTCPIFAPSATAKARRLLCSIPGRSTQIIPRYNESIHGKGLLKSGLTVTATCTSCHTAHRELPASDPESTVNPRNLPATCGNCHHGIEEQFVQSIHSSRGNQDR